MADRAITAEVTDLEDVEPDVPIWAAKRIDGWAIHDSYRDAERVALAMGDSRAAKVFGAIAKLCSPAPNFEQPGEAYTPFWTEGPKRSFLPDDLQPEDLPFVEAIAERTASAWLRARFIDYLFLKRVRRDLWPSGVTAYIAAGSENLTNNPREGVKCLARGLDLARTILGRGKAGELEVRDDAMKSIRASIRTIDAREGSNLLKIVAEKRLCESNELIALASELAGLYLNSGAYRCARGCLTVAAAALRRSGDIPGSEAVMLKAAATYETEADIFLATGAARRAAANELLVRGIQALRDSRAPQADIERLTSKLRESQRASVVEDAAQRVGWDQQPFEVDAIQRSYLNEMERAADRAKKFVEGLPWSEALIKFATGHRLRSPDEYRDEVLRGFDETPMLSLITRIRGDDKGRTVHLDERFRLITGTNAEEAMLRAQFEAARTEWEILCMSYVDPCRQQILEEHNLTFSEWGALLTANPIVPPAHSFAIMRGLHAGLHGDWLVCAHVLAVKMEAIIRHVLFEKGVDTTTIEKDLTQSEKMTGGLLGLAEKHAALPASLLFALRAILVEKSGFGLRHGIAHGLTTDQGCYSEATMSLWWLTLHLCVMGGRLMMRPGSEA